VPADEVDEHLDEIPRDRTVITYCTWLFAGFLVLLALKLLSQNSAQQPASYRP